MKIDKPTQIEPVKPSPRKLADKETQAESIKYYDIENACETPGEGFPGQLIRTDSETADNRVHGTLRKMQPTSLPIMDCQNL